MRRPSKAKLQVGDIVRVVWFDIEGKSGWTDQEAVEGWVVRPFFDCITYAYVKAITATANALYK